MTNLNLYPVKQVKEDREFVQENEWMIRPCPVYKGEYTECRAFKGRFYQYYRDGKLQDCNEWYNSHYDCKRFTINDDYAAGVRLINGEMQRLDKRIKAHKENDVWKPRKKRPPPNWTPRLPPHIEAYQKESYFLGKEEEMRQGFDSEKKSSCVIS